jgi:hypothetical protein
MESIAEPGMLSVEADAKYNIITTISVAGTGLCPAITTLTLS